jgi:anti-sigma-K factor RskA
MNEALAMIQLHLSTLEAKDVSYQSSKIMVAWDSFQHHGTIAMQNLPEPPAGRNYQLWVLDPGALSPISAGIIHPGKPSGAFTVNTLTTTNPGFAITLEPGGGSPQPTSAILFAVAPGQ